MIIRLQKIIPCVQIDGLIAAQDANAAKRREVRLFHILVRTPDGATADEAKATDAKADKARKRIDAGESFEQVAIGTSDASNALQGGDVGHLAYCARLHIDEITHLLRR